MPCARRERSSLRHKRSLSRSATISSGNRRCSRRAGRRGPNYDQAKRELRTAEAQVEAAEAQLKTAHDQVDFTELKADAEGVVTAVGAEPGEVAQAGQMIVRLAPQGGRDAVFDVPAQVLRTAPSDPVVNVQLANDPSDGGRSRAAGLPSS
jgi:multidrug efflux pump subunit AcrA (membrane-fusion protein)